MENRANELAGQITTPVIDGLVKPSHPESSKQGNGAGLQMMAEQACEIEQEVSTAEEASVEAQLYHEVCMLLDAVSIWG